MVTRAEALAAWDRAIIDASRTASWNDREAAVSPAFTTESLGHLCEIAQDLQRGARWALERRLESLGCSVSVFDRDVEVRTRCPWFITTMRGADEVRWCVEDEPSEWGDDWYGDPLDSATPVSDQVRDAGDDLTVALTDGAGLMLLTTSKRVEPRRLRSRR